MTPRDHVLYAYQRALESQDRLTERELESWAFADYDHGTAAAWTFARNHAARADVSPDWRARIWLEYVGVALQGTHADEPDLFEPPHRIAPEVVTAIRAADERTLSRLDRLLQAAWRAGTPDARDAIAVDILGRLEPGLKEEAFGHWRDEDDLAAAVERPAPGP